MKKFISLSQYPGKTGQTYYTKHFSLLGLNYSYEPRGTDNLAQSISHALEEDVEGISISMPFKQDIIQYLDQADDLVTKYNSCNTVVIKNKRLTGYNTDYYGAKHIISQIPSCLDINILGDGSMGTMIKSMLGNSAKVFSRQHGNWDQRHTVNGIVINCTSFGTATEESPFINLPLVNLVIDLAIKPNQLEQQCRNSQVKYIHGLEFYKYQFLKQFEIYTGKIPNINDF